MKIQEKLYLLEVQLKASILVAYAWGRDNVKEGDIIVTTEYEHHSNIVPWQLLTQEKKAKLKYIDIDDNGELMLEQLDDYLSTEK